jgi:hypothetical protein
MARCNQHSLPLTVIQEYKLDRLTDERVRYGRKEVQLIIEEALKTSESSGRLVKIQLVCMILCSFYMGSRPSTLAASAKEFVEQGKVSHSTMLVFQSR